LSRRGGAPSGAAAGIVFGNPGKNNGEITQYMDYKRSF